MKQKGIKSEQGKTAINDLIFKELIKRGYSLEGNTRIWNIADSKLWYLTPEQAQAFLDLENSKDYNEEVIQKEIKLINEHMDEILGAVGKEPLNILDIGCGDGKKALIFAEHLKGKIKMRYCPIDISGYMVEKAIKNISSIHGVDEVVKFQWNISDFENLENIAPLLRRDDYKKNFFLLLGNTIGNFEINELMYEIKSAMKEGEFLIIGNGLSASNPKEVLKAYNNKFLDNLLIRTLTQIGLDRDNLEYNAKFQNSRIEMYYTIKNDCKIEFLGKKVYFYKGDQIIVAVSYHYNKEDFMSFMKLYFNDVLIWLSKDKSYALALCKK